MTRSATPPQDVHWAGEAQALEALGEKKAFVARLLKLGYKPNEFRVTVRSIRREGPNDQRTRYNVFVDQLRNGMPYRGRPYLGGHPERWIEKFAANALADFPHPFPELTAD
jgi:hypothetical protein